MSPSGAQPTQSGVTSRSDRPNGRRGRLDWLAVIAYYLSSARSMLCTALWRGCRRGLGCTRGWRGGACAGGGAQAVQRTRSIRQGGAQDLAAVDHVEHRAGAGSIDIQARELVEMIWAIG